MRQYQAFRQLVRVTPTLAGLGADVSSEKSAYSAPAYSAAPLASDAKMGVNSLPYIQSRLAKHIMVRRGKPAYGMIPYPDLPSSSQVPVDVVVAQPAPPPVPVLVGHPAGGGGGGGVVTSDPGFAPDSAPLLEQGYGANAYAYGGQSIVNVAVHQGPSHDVEGYAYPGSASGADGSDGAGLLPEDDGSWVRFALGAALGWAAVSWLRRRA